jgi:tripartite-type tricarboxylate transporter receptor subunit TctC
MLHSAKMLFLAAAVFAVSNAASAADQPIRLVVPYPPGGAADQITRLVTSDASKFLKTTIVIDNKPGAAGIIAAETVARSAPDGKTLLVGSNAPLVINSAIYEKLPYDPARDFVPVAGGKTPLMLSVRAELPVESVKDLVALGKSQPGS